MPLSRTVQSNQVGVHPDLLAVLTRHRSQEYRKPIAAHTRRAFETACKLVAQSGQPVILDSGCGVGESTFWLARQHPRHFVLGIDKSEARLDKSSSRSSADCDNVAFVRAELTDFWRLAALVDWQVDKHFLLYPNPWPKKSDLKKRFHGHPAFFDLIKLGHLFELRSNWPIYLEEFATAFHFATGLPGEVRSFLPDTFITPFERKYATSGQALYRLELIKP